MREICFDTETTGFEPETGDKLVEIGAVELINHVPTGKIYHEYINPERDVPEEVVKIHGLDLKNAVFKRMTGIELLILWLLLKMNFLERVIIWTHCAVVSILITRRVHITALYWTRNC